jgi:hypothetical protein
MPGASPRSLANTLIHPLARMLPQLRFQNQVYRLGERNPPVGSMIGHTPNWAITELLLDPLASQQVRMNLQPDYHWLAITASSNAPAVPMSFNISTILWQQVGTEAFINTRLADQTGWEDPPPGTLITYHDVSAWPAMNGQAFAFDHTEDTGFPTPIGGRILITNLPFVDLPPAPRPPAVNEVPTSGSISFTFPAIPLEKSFRAQIYDTRKALRMADRGVNVGNLGGSLANVSGDQNGVYWLRDPYRFDLPDSQVLLIVQNLVNQTNAIQVALYGQVLRFNDPGAPR